MLLSTIGSPYIRTDPSTREAWGWVHYMLQTSDDTANVLLQYVASLETSKTPSKMLTSLEAAVPTYFNDVEAHVVLMQNTRTLAQQN